MINNRIRLTVYSRVRVTRDVDRGYALRSIDTPNLLTSLSTTNLNYQFYEENCWEMESSPTKCCKAL